jgi:thiol-disulfide isomerase/thioredoxin
VLAGLLCAGALAASEVRADPSRFIPWTQPEPPPLVLNDLAGRRHALADYRGRVVLVNFWATWCEPCLDEMPSIQRLKTRLSGRPFEVLAVNYGEFGPKVGAFAGRLAVDFRILLDPNREASRAWRVRLLPASFLVGPDGRPRYSVIGEIDWTSAEAVKTVLELLP